MNLFKWFLGVVCALCLACAGEAGTGYGTNEDAAMVADGAETDASADTASTDRAETGDAATDAPTRPNCENPLLPGSRIQGTGPAVYYLAENGRRWVFPNSVTYFSWFPSFDGICVIPDAQLAAIYIGGNVTFRPGTWLAKITTDPKVYAVTRCGVLHWIESESVATALYGPNWNVGLMVEIPEWMVRRTRDVPDAFFVNYSVGASIARPIHPDGTLIRYSGDTTTYLVMGARKRRVTPDGFRVNRFNQWFVADTEIAYPDSTDAPVTSYERELSEPSCP